MKLESRLRHPRDARTSSLTRRGRSLEPLRKPQASGMRSSRLGASASVGAGAGAGAGASAHPSSRPRPRAHSMEVPDRRGGRVASSRRANDSYHHSRRSVRRPRAGSDTTAHSTDWSHAGYSPSDGTADTYGFDAASRTFRRNSIHTADFSDLDSERYSMLSYVPDLSSLASQTRPSWSVAGLQPRASSRGAVKALVAPPSKHHHGSGSPFVTGRRGRQPAADGGRSAPRKSSTRRQAHRRASTGVQVGSRSRRGAGRSQAAAAAPPPTSTPTREHLVASIMQLHGKLASARTTGVSSSASSGMVAAGPPLAMVSSVRRGRRTARSTPGSAPAPRSHSLPSRGEVVAGPENDPRTGSVRATGGAVLSSPPSSPSALKLYGRFAAPRTRRPTGKPRPRAHSAERGTFRKGIRKTFCW